MLIVMKSLVALQKNETIEIAKQITSFLNYSASHMDSVIEYRRSGMIPYIYLDSEYISEPEAHS